MLHRETRGEWVSGRAAERQLKSKSKEGRERKREGTRVKTEQFPIRWNAFGNIDCCWKPKSMKIQLNVLYKL